MIEEEEKKDRTPEDREISQIWVPDGSKAQQLPVALTLYGNLDDARDLKHSGIIQLLDLRRENVWSLQNVTRRTVLPDGKLIMCTQMTDPLTNFAREHIHIYAPKMLKSSKGGERTYETAKLIPAFEVYDDTGKQRGYVICTEGTWDGPYELIETDNVIAPWSVYDQWLSVSDTVTVYPFYWPIWKDYSGWNDPADGPYGYGFGPGGSQDTPYVTEKPEEVEVCTHNGKTYYEIVCRAEEVTDDDVGAVNTTTTRNNSYLNDITPFSCFVQLSDGSYDTLFEWYRDLYSSETSYRYTKISYGGADLFSWTLTYHSYGTVRRARGGEQIISISDHRDCAHFPYPGVLGDEYVAFHTADTGQRWVDDAEHLNPSLYPNIVVDLLSVDPNTYVYNSDPNSLCYLGYYETSGSYASGYSARSSNFKDISHGGVFLGYRDRHQLYKYDRWQWGCDTLELPEKQVVTTKLDDTYGPITVIWYVNSKSYQVFSGGDYYANTTSTRYFEVKGEPYVLACARFPKTGGSFFEYFQLRPEDSTPLHSAHFDNITTIAALGGICHEIPGIITPDGKKVYGKGEYRLVRYEGSTITVETDQ